MIKWLKKFKLKNTKYSASKYKNTSAKQTAANKAKASHFCLQMRVDDKGLVYYPATTKPALGSDVQAYAQICETMGYIALMEMREKDRVLH